MTGQPLSEERELSIRSALEYGAAHGENAGEFRLLISEGNALMAEIDRLRAKVARLQDQAFDDVRERQELRVKVARLREEKGRAEELLGREGAGGSAAGLVPAIHNLVSRAEKAEAEVARLEAALAEHQQAGDALYATRNLLGPSRKRAVAAWRALRSGGQEQACPHDHILGDDCPCERR